MIGTLFQHNLNIAVSSLKWHFPESSKEGNFTYTVRRVICVVVVQREGLHSKPKMASITRILPAGPDCPLNRNYLRRLRHSLITRSSPPDFSARNRSALILLSCKKSCLQTTLSTILRSRCNPNCEFSGLSREDSYRGRVGLEDLSPVGRAMMGWPAKLDPTTSKTCPP